MKKTFSWRKMISLVLALILCVSLPITIWAETTVEEIENEDGTHTTLTTTTTTETDGDKTTVTITITENTFGTNTDGEEVDTKTTTVTTTETTPDGTTSTETTVSKTEETLVVDPYESGIFCPVGPEDYEGKGYFDGNYDTDNYRDGLLEGVDKDYLEENKLIDPDKPAIDGYEEGFDMLWTGYGEYTDGAAPVVAEEVVYLLDENGNIVTENGYPVIDMEKTNFLTGKNGRADETGMIGQSIMFALKHENGNYFYAYCMDAATSTSPDFDRWYNFNNIEDAIESEENPDGYISEEDAGMIRAIANAGYWGTETGKGSLDSLKELLYATYDADTVINVRHPGSNDVVYSSNLYELIDGLSEYEALACTQAAIWSYANNGDYVYNQGTHGGLVTDATVIGILSAYKFNASSGKPGLNEYKPAGDGESDARLQALYMALMNLDPIYAESNPETTVIPDEGAIFDASLEILDKVVGEENNYDDVEDNDVFNTNVKFKLSFIPGANDNLTVKIDYVDLEGNPVSMVRRLAGENSGTEDYLTILPDANGNYTISGIKLMENSDFEFDLKLTGTQYLENGVYIYQAEGGRKESQTLVGLAEGTQKVEVSAKFTMNFNVDNNTPPEDPDDPPVTPNDPPEDPEDPPVTPNDPPEDPEDPPVTPNDPPEDPEDPPMTPDDPPTPRNTPPEEEEFIPEEDVPLDEEPIGGGDDDEIEILDEEVPLAEVPETGDTSTIFMMLAIFSVIGLVAVNFPRKKVMNF